MVRKPPKSGFFCPHKPFKPPARDMLHAPLIAEKSIRQERKLCGLRPPATSHKSRITIHGSLATRDDPIRIVILSEFASANESKDLSSRVLTSHWCAIPLFLCTYAGPWIRAGAPRRDRKDG